LWDFILECGSLLPLCSADLWVGIFSHSHPADLKVSATAPARASSSRKSGSKLPHSKPLRHHGGPPRARKPLDVLAFEGIWGEPWSPAADGEPTRGIQ